MHSDFAGVDTWIFDLDNTLYPAECHLFAQIDARMTSFIEERLDLDRESARTLQKAFYVQYGTTLSGLMTEHDVPPTDFLDYVHDIDLGAMDANAPLGEAIGALPGRKLIFTNGSVRHAENVAGKLGILDRFSGIFDIAAGGYVPKPHADAYAIFIDRFSVDPTRAAFFEDIHQNLIEPSRAGMRTVLVQSAADWFEDEPAEKRPARPGEQPAHVQQTTADLTAFLRELTSADLTPAANGLRP